MFTRDDEGFRRFLDVRLFEWIWLSLWCLLWLAPFPLLIFGGMGWKDNAFFGTIFSVLSFLAIRLGYQNVREIGKPLHWERLPIILPKMVRGKTFTREQAIGIYDLFFYHVSPSQRETDLAPFAPLPPKETKWFLENWS